MNSLAFQALTRTLRLLAIFGAVLVVVLGLPELIGETAALILTIVVAVLVMWWLEYRYLRARKGKA